MAEETRKKITEKYGNDFSQFIKEPSPKVIISRTFQYVCPCSLFKFHNVSFLSFTPLLKNKGICNILGEEAKER
jgi:hypothetical protein